MALYRDTLYVGGQFSADNYFGAGINDIAKVYNTELHAVGHGHNGNSIVEALAVYNDTLFIGGAFSTGNFGEYSYLATYANGRLEPYFRQPDARIVAMKTYGDALYVAGWFRNFDDSVACHIVKLENGNLEILNHDSLYNFWGDEQSPLAIRDIDIYNDTLYLAGGFYAIGQDTALNGIAKLNRALGGISGVSEHISNIHDFRIYPNPSETVGIEFHLPAAEELQFCVYDATGKQLFQWKELFKNGIHRKVYSFPALPSGLYIVRIWTETGTFQTKRWIKGE